MKCQKCSKPATWHITDLVGGKPVEIHLCQEHAQEYLKQTQGGLSGMTNSASSLATHLAQQMAFSKASSEFSQADQETCPTCGMTFFEFRANSRLGCPDDYRVFEKQLTPVLINIHGENHHTGKVPKRFGEPESRRLTGLIRMRKELEEAVTAEKYEEASILRDQIKNLEREAGIE